MTKVRDQVGARKGSSDPMSRATLLSVPSDLFQLNLGSCGHWILLGYSDRLSYPVTQFGYREGLAYLSTRLHWSRPRLTASARLLYHICPLRSQELYSLQNTVPTSQWTCQRAEALRLPPASKAEAALPLRILNREVRFHIFNFPKPSSSQGITVCNPHLPSFWYWDSGYSLYHNYDTP